MRESDEAGFSLIELLVVLSIIMTMTGITALGMGSYRGRITERQVRGLADEISLTRKCQEMKPGSFRLRLIQSGHIWEAVIERTMDPDAVVPEWTLFEKRTLGSGNSLSIFGEDGESLREDGEGGFHTWRFDRGTGACVAGEGKLRLRGPGKSYTLTVYGPTGRVEVKGYYGE